MSATNGSRHLSVFELDTWFASLPAERAAETTAHVASCALCAQHLAALEEDRPVIAARRPFARLFPAAAAVLALAAAVALFVRTRPLADDASYVGIKGVPGAQVLVQRGGTLRVWDGVSPVRAGDALALRVACEQLLHVTVASAADGGTLARAWEGPCPPPGEALPFTLVVDDRPGREHVDIVLSRARLDDARLAGAVRGASRNAETWTIAFDFGKEEQR